MPQVQGMGIVLNGDRLEIPQGTRLTDLLDQLKLRPEMVVVELNLNILERREYPQRVLEAGDRLEIVRIVGGGSNRELKNPRGASLLKKAAEAQRTTKPRRVVEHPLAQATKQMPLSQQTALVVVESPTKARTLDRFLGSGYKVLASQGHVMDLPSSQFGVDLENDFAPKYIVIVKKRKIVKELKAAAAKFKELYLATDPDREGEAISAHLATLLGEGKKVHRAVFHEITPAAVKAAFQHPSRIDEHKVEAQQARRILDRILGYSLSPLLWKNVGRGLSAGRVQSVALRLIVDREREIRAFVPQEYWEIMATLAKLHPSPKEPPSFTASLETIDGKKAELKDGDSAGGVVTELKDLPFTVSSVGQKATQRHPSPPFTTSTLQQEAFNKLGSSAARTMRVAQQLYEGIELGPEGPVGLITYMRTDSVQVAGEAKGQAKRFIQERFGEAYLPESPRQYRSRRGAQEAHEAIRPTSVERVPDQIKGFLTPDQLKLYTLIWNRFLASQMESARLEVTTIEITAGRFGFRASGTKILFPGFLKALQPAEKSEGEETATSSQPLPALTRGEKLKPLKIEPSQHFTKPPPRYTEASLVRTMEELGIGRPSTYAPTIQTISTRGYVNHQGRALVPDELGETVTDLLAKHFPKVLDVKFTARMEEELDEVEEGNQEWVKCVREFYEPFSDALKTAATEMRSVKPAPVPTDETCPQCGKPIVIKWGRNGRFLSCSGFPECRFAKPITTGVKCPEPDCGGELVRRRSRRGLFYGCSRFPACRHIERQLPSDGSLRREVPDLPPG
ncbi:MAG: type I DNA topoisomerase [Candidatus Omnitrophica bacterium]|nr:type I DNA topoisomerase [Candidatus Omnitrophota bacterium]